MFVSAACNDVVFDELLGETGYLGVNIGVDDEVATKAIVDPAENMTFRIEVYKGLELVYETDDHRELTQSDPLELKVGKYKVKAIHGDNSAGFSAPYYVGETEVQITTDDLTTIDITCALANVLVTVDFEDSIKDNFNSYSVYVEDGSGHGITFAASNLGAEGYIPATGTLKWTLTLINSEGKNYTYTETYSDVKARQHYNLQVALSDKIENAGYAAIRLIVDDTLVEQKYDIELDFSESEMPSVATSEGFELTNEIAVIVGDASKKELAFSAPEGITSFVLTLDSVAKPYELVDASQETINALSAMGIKTQSLAFGSVSAKVDLTDYIKDLATGSYKLSCRLYDAKGHVASAPMNISVISDVDAIVESVTPWAKFVIAKGKYFAPTAPEGLAFMYRKSSGSDWASVTGSALEIDAATKTFVAEIGGLDASTDYEIKAVSAADMDTDPISFKTESAGTLYNMNFEDWYQDGKIYYPYAKSVSNKVWDCANPATASFTESYTTPDSHVPANTSSTKSVRMESEYVVVKFAAGNLFTGTFVDFSTKGAELDWGEPFTSRPVALRGYYDYTSGGIDKVKDPYKGMKGQPDKCQIQVFLTDWDGPFRIDTPNNVFVDVSTNNKSIIAFGKIESEVTTNGYKEFTIPLEYRDLTRTPKRVVISCCSSYLGDYFTGSTSSVLYVDEFTFEYDVTTLTPEEKAKVNYR